MLMGLHFGGDMNASFVVAVFSLLCAVTAAHAQQTKAAASSPDEPIAKKMSLAKTAEFLDTVAVNWTQQRKCGACHTNYAYMMSRPLLKDVPGEGMDQVRKFFEGRVANWDEP